MLYIIFFLLLWKIMNLVQKNKHLLYEAKKLTQIFFF